MRGQADSALLDPCSQCYPVLGGAGTAAAGSACPAQSWISVKVTLQLIIIHGELHCLVKASCVGMPRLTAPPEICGQLPQEPSKHQAQGALPNFGCRSAGRAVIVEPVWWLLGQGHGASQPAGCLSPLWRKTEPPQCGP